MLTIHNSNSLISADVSDSKLVKEIQSKSIEASNVEILELHRRHSHDVYRMTRSLYDSTEEGIKSAEDLYQDAWQRALERIDRYDTTSGRSFGAWVKGIADNLFLEGYRQQVRQATAVNELTHLTSKAEHPILDELDNGDLSIDENGVIRRESLLDALNVLTSTEKEILLEWFRTFNKNDPGNEIHAKNLDRLCEKFEIQKDSIRKIKQRAVEKIKQFLQV